MATELSKPLAKATRAVGITPAALSVLLVRAGQHTACTKSVGLEAIGEVLHAGIRNAHEPHGLVAGADVRDTDTELFQAAFQAFDSEILLRHLISPYFELVVCCTASLA